jgi:1-acyl-sn-glycerol-3-phosphate acyltransferase
MITVRSVLFNIWFFGMTLCLSVFGILLRICAPARVFGLGRLWGRLGVDGARLICGIEVEVIGRQNLPQSGPALIAAQHQSAFDTMVFLTLMPRTAYVVKQELARIPLFGPLAELAGMIPVDRNGGGGAIRALLRGTDHAVATERQLVIFPEGTRSAYGQLGSLQPGIAAMAARSRLPVVPVVTDSGRLWSRRAFRKRAGTIHMLAMPAIEAGLPRAALMQRLREAFAEGSAQLVDNSVGRAPTKFAFHRS